MYNFFQRGFLLARPNFYKPRATELAEMSNPVLISVKKKMFYQGNAHC